MYCISIVGIRCDTNKNNDGRGSIRFENNYQKKIKDKKKKGKGRNSFTFRRKDREKNCVTSLWKCRGTAVFNFREQLCKIIVEWLTGRGNNCVTSWCTV